MSSISDPGRVAVYPGFVAETDAISMASNVAGGVGIGPTEVTTTGMSVLLMRSSLPHLPVRSFWYLDRHGRRRALKQGRVDVVGRMVGGRILGDDQAGEELREPLLGPRDVKIRRDLLDNRLLGREAIVGIEWRFSEVEQKRLAQRRDVDPRVASGGRVGFDLNPGLAAVLV